MQNERKRLLILLNDKHFASIIAKTANSHGFDAKICDSAQDAKLRLKKDRYCGIIIDADALLQMQRTKSVRSIPIFALSNGADSKLVSKIRELGVKEHYFYGHIRPSELIKHITAITQ
ncbi:MAG: hypothetical protein ACD_76C00101G0006 [uncultured bacterium]|nr:MAG: hypothetical protein ACD_76C00101G0006 [uncultured bacterium]HBD05683.1 hypothetical protein [Candidatus Uhrbacteria bacterium]